MKNHVFATFSCLALLTAATAFAQGPDVLQADIPFAFHVSQNVLPAGHYDVIRQVGSNLLTFRCSDRHASATVISSGINAPKTQEAGKLVFNRYGRAYFLSTVWSPGVSLGRLLPKSKAEREMARNASAAPPVEVALIRQ